ncbi:hypothetical protein LPB41_19720 [Thalassospira sp. MA62]|nr:hypothetical protein [Thalassospira sp. MA62]
MSLVDRAFAMLKEKVMPFDVAAVPAGFVGPAPRADFYDLSDWPIAVIRFPELGEEDRVNGVLGGLGTLLDQKVPFVAVWIPASHDHDDEPHEDERTSNIWVKHHREALNTYCRGYIYLAEDEDMFALLDERAEKIGGRLFKFPMKVVRDRETAISVGREMMADAS